MEKVDDSNAWEISLFTDFFFAVPLGSFAMKGSTFYFTASGTVYSNKHKSELPLNSSDLGDSGRRLKGMQRFEHDFGDGRESLLASDLSATS
jgi:hypothetical protein